jgi:AraC-like DNA-binding protein
MDYFKLINGFSSKNYYADPELTPFIKYYSIYNSSNIQSFINMQLISNDCVDLAIHLDDSSTMVNKNHEPEIMTSYIVGFWEIEKKKTITSVTNNHNCMGLIIHLTPLGVKKLLNCTLGDFYNRIVDADEILGKNIHFLQERLKNENSIDQRIYILNDFFKKLISGNFSGNQIDFSLMNKSIINSQSIPSVENLANLFNLSYRSLHRKFIMETALSPKAYLRIVRFNFLCRLLKKHSYIQLEDIIYRAGYYDMPHFVKEFKKIMNASPAKFLKKCKGKFMLARPILMENEA